MLMRCRSTCASTREMSSRCRCGAVTRERDTNPQPPVQYHAIFMLYQVHYFIIDVHQTKLPLCRRLRSGEEIDRIVPAARRFAVMVEHSLEFVNCNAVALRVVQTGVKQLLPTPTVYPQRVVDSAQPGPYTAETRIVDRVRR